MIAENFAEKGRQRSYAEFSATDVKGFYLIIVFVAIQRFYDRGLQDRPHGGTG